MKLFLRRNVSAERIIFTVYDAQGFEKYNVVSKKTKAYSGIVIKDLENKIFCKIRRLPVVATNSYVFRTGKKNITFVCIPVTNSIKCRFYGINWHVIGNMSLKDFSIVDVDNTVIASHKKALSDYELNIYNTKDEIISLATAVCIDIINTVDNLAPQAI